MSIWDGALKGAAWGSAAGPFGTAAGAVAGGIAGAAPFSGHDPKNNDLFGPGEDGTHVPDYAAADAAGSNGGPDARSNAYQWGGAPGMAAADQGYARDRANYWGNLQSPGANHYQSNRYIEMGDQAREGQSDSLRLLGAAARGEGQSQAAIQMGQGNDQAMANSLALAAGARGAGAMAGANQNAIANNSVLATNNINNTGALRANEMAQARQAYMGGASSMRGQDLGFFGQASNNANANAQLGLGYRQLGQQGELGFEGLRNNIGSAQLGAQMGMYGAKDADFAHRQEINQQSRANDIKTAGTVVDGIGTTMKFAGSL